MLLSRVLIVGHGSIGRRHLRLARQIAPSADIRILRHQPSVDIPEYSNGCFTSIDEALDFSPQVAVIASPAPFHLEMAQPLADAGVHLLIEKPLSSGIEGVYRLIETCHKQGVVLMVGYNLRFSPSLQAFRKLLADGAIGDILTVRSEVGQYLPSWRPYCDYRLAVSGQRKLGGGVVLELSHELDYLRWIFGEIEYVNATLCQQSGLEIDVEDTAYLTLGFSSESGTKQIIGTVCMDFIRHDTTRTCVVIGEKGTLRWNGLTGTVDQFRQDKGIWCDQFNSLPESDDTYIAEWNNFILSISGKEVPLVCGEDGLRVLQVIKASYLSSKSACRVLVGQDQAPESVHS